MINQDYVNWLVNFIKNGTINIKTNLPFKYRRYKTTGI